MDAKSFIEETVRKLEESRFEALKEKLLGEYVTFSFFENEEISCELLSEKLADHIEKLKIKTDKSFDQVIANYMSAWDDMVKDLIKKEASPAKDDKKAELTRAKRYYNRVVGIKNEKEVTVEKLVDYSRVMMCLYAAIIKNEYKKISDFDFAVTCLDNEAITESMKSSYVYVANFGVGPVTMGKKKKSRFNTKGKYSLDKSVFLLTEILFQCIMND